MTDIDSMEALYDALKRHISILANAVSSPTQILMERDELIGELSFELCKGWLYYKDKELPDAELLSVVCRMLQNRIAELQVRFYYTHRKAGSSALLIDDLEIPGGSYPAQYVESIERVRKFFASLSDIEGEVVRALLGNDRRIVQQLVLQDMRRSFVFKNPTLRYTSKMISDALHIDIVSAKIIWKSIAVKWKESYE